MRQNLDSQGETLAPSRGWLKTFDSLRIRNFRWYWYGMLAAFVAMQMQVLAQGWLVYALSESALALGLVSAAWGIPVLILSLFGGVVTDRVEKRNLLIITQGIVGAITIAVTILIATGLVQVWHMFVASFLSGSTMAFAMPGRQAIIPELVGPKELMNAIGLNSSAMNVCRIGAPALAGVLIGLIGITGVYIIILLCCLLAIGAFSMIPVAGTVALRPNTPMRHDLLAGLGYIRHSPTILSLLAMSFLIVIFGMPYTTMMPVFTVEVFRTGATGLGILMSVTGVGALAGSLFIAYLGDYNRKGLLLAGTAVLFGVSIIFFALAGSFYLSLVFLLFAGAGGTGCMAINNTLVQTNVTHEVRGRVMSVYMMTWGLMPLGTLPTSWTAEALGAPLAVAAGGSLLTLFSLGLALAYPKLRHLE